MDDEQVLTQNITSWSKDLVNLPPISHRHLIEDTIGIDQRSSGAIKHRIEEYQLFNWRTLCKEHESERQCCERRYYKLFG